MREQHPSEPRIGGGLYPGMKRVLDVLLTLVLLVVASPVFLLIALALMLESSGPLFYVPRVVGFGGKEFALYKFRSMLPGSDVEHRAMVEQNFREQTAAASDAAGRPVFKTALAEPGRITAVGRWLRKTSLDELPQLWNVLKGDMSLVGPRPALPYEAALYDDYQRLRFSV